MKKICFGFIAILMVSVMMTLNVLAMPFNPNDYTSVDLQSKLLPTSTKQSMATSSATLRGEFFLSADIIIKDDGNGDIGAFGKAYMAVPVDEVYVTIYLDRWDESSDRWRQVTYYDAEFYAKDYPNGLSAPSVSLTFKNQEKGYYYRLRGVFGAVKNGKFEGFSPVTDGILIE